MSVRQRLFASAARFAQLAGNPARAGTVQDDRENGPTDPEDVENEPTADDGDGSEMARADDTEGDDGKNDGKRARRAAKPGNAEDEDPNGGEGGDEDDDDEEEVKKAKAAGFGPLLARQSVRARHAERKRCARIFSASAAVGRVPAAAHLAFDTGMSSQVAVGILASLPATAAGGGDLRTLMDRQARPAPGPGGGNNAAASPGGRLAAATQRLVAEQEAKRTRNLNGRN